MRSRFALLLLLLYTPVHAQQGFPPLKWYEEGTLLTPQLFKANCVGAGITCAANSASGWYTITVPGGGTPDFPILAPDGSVSAPSYAFTNGTNFGLYYVASGGGSLRVAANGQNVGTITSGIWTIAEDLVQNSGTVTLTPNGTSSFAPSAGDLTLDAAATLNVGTAAQTALNIGRSGIVTSILGTPKITSTLDRIAAGTMSLGTATANAISIGGSGINTTFGGAILTGGNVDRSSAAALSIGTVNASSVTIGITSTTTTIKGDVDFPTGTDNNFTHTFSSAATTTAGNTFTTTNTGSSGTVVINGVSIPLAGTTTSGANTIVGIHFPAVTTIANNTFNAINFPAANNYNNFLVSPTINVSAAGAITGCTGVTLTTGSNLVVGSNTLTTSDQLNAAKLLIASQAANDLLYASSTTAWTRLANGTTGQVLTATTGSAPSWATPAGGGGGNAIAGAGNDGAVTISSDTTLTKNMQYLSLTIDSTKTLYPNGFIIEVAGTLTVNGTIDMKGGNASGTSQGTSPGAGVICAGSRCGERGANGGTGPFNGAAGSSLANAIGGVGGASGQSGQGQNGSNAGTVTAPTAGNSGYEFITALTGYMQLNTLALAAVRSGTGGAVGGCAAGCTSGAGGGGGGIILIHAKDIVISSTGLITVAGGNASAVSAGNGGGSGGGGGGVIFLMSGSLTINGSAQSAAGAITPSAYITAAGGAAGALGGTGSAGSAGSAGVIYWFKNS